MNYILIATDKYGTDTVLLKQISDNCTLKITQIQSKSSVIPHYQFSYIDCVEQEFEPFYQVIKDVEAVERLESQILLGFNSLFNQFIV